ncbi:MAG: acyltransferase family protein [Methylophilus sp.]|nr:acyltransferase family protein [Methylophilus sp.]
MDNLRDAHVDSAKGIGIILVVLGHVPYFEKSELAEVIYSFHMPLFFLLSGIYLNSNSSFFNFLSKKLDQLIKPYFMMVGAIVIFHTLQSFFGFFPVEKLPQLIVGKLYAVGETISWLGDDPFVQLWFLPTLFLVSLFVFLIVKFLQKLESNITQNQIMLLLLAVTFFFISPFFLSFLSENASSIFFYRYNTLPWNFDLIFITSAFYALGYALRSQIKKLEINVVLILLSISVLSFLYFNFDAVLVLNDRQFGIAWVTLTEALLGIYLTLALSKSVGFYTKPNQILTYFGLRSLWIYLFHLIFMTLSIKFFSHFISNTPVLNFLGFVAGILLPIILCEIYFKWKAIQECKSNL